MERHRSRDGIRTFQLGTIVLREEVFVRFHVIIEEKKNLSRGRRGTAVSRVGEAAVRLSDDAHGERWSQFRETVLGIVGRAVDDDNELEHADVCLVA